MDLYGSMYGSCYLAYTVCELGIDLYGGMYIRLLTCWLEVS